MTSPKAVFFVKQLSEIFEMVKKAFHCPTESVELDKNALMQECLEWLNQEAEHESP